VLAKQNAPVKKIHNSYIAAVSSGITS